MTCSEMCKDEKNVKQMNLLIDSVFLLDSISAFDELKKFLKEEREMSKEEYIDFLDAFRMYIFHKYKEIGAIIKCEKSKDLVKLHCFK